jgi:hypothetical protein
VRDTKTKAILLTTKDRTIADTLAADYNASQEPSKGLWARLKAWWNRAEPEPVPEWKQKIERMNQRIADRERRSVETV